MSGSEFQLYINNLYFDPRDLLDQNDVTFSRLISLSHSSYLSFYGDLSGLSLFLNTVIRCDFKMKMMKNRALHEPLRNSSHSKRVFWSHLLTLALMLTNRPNSFSNKKQASYQSNVEDEIDRNAIKINKQKQDCREFAREFNLNWQDFGHFEKMFANKIIILPMYLKKRICLPTHTNLWCISWLQ
jgi:hypothetical protein